MKYRIMLDKKGHFVEYFSYDHWMPITNVSFRENDRIDFFVQSHYTLYGSQDECKQWIKDFHERWLSKPKLIEEIEI